MLMNLLPGLRELRTPLAVGYVWLVTIWLCAADHLPSRDSATGVFASLYKGIGRLDQAALIAVASFCAYIIGSTVAVKFVRTAPRIKIPAIRAWEPWRTEAPKVSWDARQDLKAYAKSAIHGISFIDARRAPSSILQDRRTGRDEAVFEAMEATLMELDHLRFQLMKASSELFSEHDRHAAEADFRCNIAIALTGLAAGLSYFQTPAFLIILPAAWVLFRRGIARAVECNDLVVQALVAGEISSTVIEARRGTSIPAQPSEE
ncbi:hypothetical protein [Kitasatospora sp. NPDC050463]|uniref:hypothetical protein n=1 Tax=Kitasatospora sp. NPDC050463 TaxID=3155786 RepID=UPI0033DC6C4A